jgi:UDP-N-acetylglucosamine 2-epimerase (non-hydrolysing)
MSAPTKVLVVIGTRPEAIKLAPLCAALRADPAFEVRVCATSQHGDLLTPMLTFFRVDCDFDLQLMTPGQTLPQITSRALEGISKILDGARFDLVVSQGDTTSAFAAGLAAFYARVKVAHVEAGLRSGDLSRPFPEEANRRLVDVVADYLFAPTDGARDHLLREGYPRERIFVTGNTGIDALLMACELTRREQRPLPVDLQGLPPGARLALVTAHRRESFGPGLESICRALSRLVERHADLHVVYPVHPNPNVGATARALLADRPRIHLIAPLDYPDFVRTLDAAALVLTDSGGVQEEAPALGKRTLVLRETTERPEGIAAGAAELVGTDEERIVARATALLDGANPTKVTSPYGDGRASTRIVEVLKTGSLSHPFAA